MHLRLPLLGPTVFPLRSEPWVPPAHPLLCRLDSLVGLFAAGCAPTATADPYGLRRAAVGMLQALIGAGARMDLGAAVEAAAGVQPLAVSAESKAAVLDFVERRLEQLLADQGVQIEAVRAALKERGRQPALAASTAREIGVSRPPGWLTEDVSRLDDG
jgi:glycyl-tRNA synthetase